MQCPKCDGLMKPVVVENVEVDRCVDCKGLWFDVMEEERLKKLAIAKQIDVGDRTVGQSMNTLPHVHCPRHPETLLTHLNVVDQPHIQIESCPACYGIFFDAGEFTDFAQKTLLESIRSFFG